MRDYHTMSAASLGHLMIARPLSGLKYLIRRLYNTLERPKSPKLSKTESKIAYFERLVANQKVIYMVKIL